MKPIPTKLLACSLTVACGPSIIGEWELDEFDENALEDELEDSTGYSVQDLNLSWNLIVESDFEGEIELEQEVDMTYVYDGMSYDINFELSLEGDLEVEIKESGYEISIKMSGEGTLKVPDLDIIEESDVDDLDEELNCTLTSGSGGSADTLTCDGVNDIEYIFTRK